MKEKTASVLAPGFVIARQFIAPPGFLRLGDPCVGHGLALDLRPQCHLELGQMPVVFDPPQARLDEDQRTGHPALFLVRRAPVIHVVGELAELGIQGFQAIGGLETDPQHGEYAQPMERERLLESLVQAVGRREVARAQFLSEPPQRRAGFRVRRSLIGLLKPSPQVACCAFGR